MASYGPLGDDYRVYKVHVFNGFEEASGLGLVAKAIQKTRLQAMPDLG